MSSSYLKSKEFTIRLSESQVESTDCDSIINALENKEISSLSGRKPLYYVTLNGKKCVLRYFYHGGILRNIFRGFFWERKSRAFNELSLIDTLKSKNLPVVNPVCAGKTEAIFYKQFLVTELLENSSDLHSLNEISHQTLNLMFDTIEQFFDTGLIHPDLNIKNMLVSRESNSLVLLDFDKAELMDRSVERKKRVKIYERLFRSFHKMGKIDVFSGFHFENHPEYIKEAYGNYLKNSRIRSFLWILNKK